MVSVSLSMNTSGVVQRRVTNIVPRASTTDRVQSTAPRPKTQPGAGNNITPFHQNKAGDGESDSFPWVVVAKNFTAAIIDSWTSSSFGEDDVDAVSAQVMIDAMESEFEPSPSSKEQKESVYGMWAEWDRY